MSPWLLFLLALVAILIAMGYLLRATAARRIAIERLESSRRDDESVANLDEPQLLPERVFAWRYWLLPWLLAIGLFFVLWKVVQIPISFAGAFSFVAALLGMQLESSIYSWRVDRIENQLADAIDLMVAAVKAGASLEGALESAVRDGRQPLRRQIEEVLGRIRYGEDVGAVLIGLTRRVPLESFRLFATTIAVNYEVGGSLALTLSAIGRTIRDRIELSRRMRSMTTQARASIVSVMGVAYFLAALMWRNDPDRFVRFLGSTFGQVACVTAVVLQGVGIVWIGAISKPRF